MQNKKQLKPSAVMEKLVILAGVWGCTVFIHHFLSNTAMIIPISGVITALCVIAWIFPYQTKAVVGVCFRYRWVLALLVFCICVCLRIHGSSIGIYDEVFPTQIEAKESTFFGKPRSIRSDEYGITTLQFFSQSANEYRMYSQLMSLSPTNMVLDFYSPVWDWALLGKPMNWGFLLFGNEVGLSWYWCSEIILIFMAALEMCLILTGGQRLESLLGAVMVTLSPSIQWWIIPHMPPVIFYAMFLFCVGYWFFTAESLVAKWASSGLAIIAALGFSLSIFPSFQVPCAYTVLVLLIVCLWRDRARISFTQREWFRIVLPIAIVLLILTRFVLNSREDLTLLLNTVYPGKRLIKSGINSIRDVFASITSLFLPYKDITYSNNCEVSTAIHFAPFFLVLSPKMFSFLRQKNDDSYIIGKALAGILLVQIIYMLAGIPRWLAEITLLRFCNRMFIVYQWPATLYTIWGFSVLHNNPSMLNKREKTLYPLAYGFFYTLLINDNLCQYMKQFQIFGQEIGTLLIILSILVFVWILLLALHRKRLLFSSLLILLMLFCGATVNPVECGIGAVTNHPLHVAVSEIAKKEPESKWLCTDCMFFIPTYLMSKGARVLDAMDFYPDQEKWAIIDPEGKYEKMTNRYANQCAELIDDDKCTVEVLSSDYLKIFLNPDKLKALHIRYLFTPVNHTELLNRYGIDCEYVFGQDGYGIYRLDYEF